MRQETLEVYGVDVELTLLRDSRSQYWLVMARWSLTQGKQTTHTMPPCDPDLTEQQAWNEARNWAERQLSKDLLGSRGLCPKWALSTAS
ncbi:hypothetical protein SAMN04487953_13328 [Billgrantia desiderata]|nr:hypothetical protein SAMN04487953_13328 [Halomonas desiderata]